MICYSSFSVIGKSWVKVERNPPKEGKEKRKPSATAEGSLCH
jgi:hypothetical protein